MVNEREQTVRNVCAMWADGTCLASVPVVGVIVFECNTIVEWRDYCDDWMRDYQPADSEHALT